ncbi:MAG: peptide ABC transporter substrate-binding protein [Ruminococcaceae bacterium]|nr:peptide ABC transporter substrate-binding protein [Oscillospiraceae bacterium]
MKRIISMIMCLAIVVVSIAGCSTLEGDDKGAIINVYLAGEVYNYDPALNCHNSDMVKFFNLIYEGLTRLDEDGNWESALMDEYTKSYNDETKEYKVTITLNSTQWSDGRSVQAQDLVFAWKRILEPTFACSAASMLFDIKNARAAKGGDVSIDDVGIVAVDTYVVEISFEYAVDLDAFFRTCASPALVPLREDVVVRNADWATKTSSMVSNGPFAVKEIDWDKDELVRLERNANYYLDDEADEALDKYVIPWRVITTYGRGGLEDQLAAFDAGEIFYLGEIPLSARAERKGSATISDEMSTHTYYFNTENELFSDVRVRQALSMAIDRNEIVNILTYAKPATGLIPYGVDDGGSDKDFRSVADSKGALVNSTADVEGAKKLLKEAGVKKNAEFTLTIREGNEADEAVAKYVVGVWKDLGFKVKVESLDVQVKRESAESANKIVIDNFGDALETGDFDVIAVDMQMLNTDAFSALSVYATKFSGGGVDMDDPEYPYIKNITGFEKKEYSDLIEKAYAEHDASKRAELLHEAEAMLMDEMPIVPLVFNQDAYLINNNVLSGSEDTYWATRDFKRLEMEDYMKYKKAILAAEEAALTA